MGGYNVECNEVGKNWYKRSDVKKAYNMISRDKDKFKIIYYKIKRVKIKEL